jgi:hypothetical protein
MLEGDCGWVMKDLPDLVGVPVHHMVLVCGIEIGRQLNFENMSSTKVAAII